MEAGKTAGLRLALCQPRSPAGDEALAMAEVERALATARAAGAHMVVLPELFLPGYNVGDIAARAQPLDGPWITDVRRKAAAAGCAIVIGYPERDGARVFNSAIAIGPDGTVLANHRKLQPYGTRESQLFLPGDVLTTFDFMDHRLALLICYDVEFAHHVRALALKGAEAILAPSANFAPYVTDFLLRGHAVSHGVCIAYVNYCGQEGDQSYCGGTSVFGQDGAVLASAGAVPALLIVDLPAARLPTDIASHLTDHRDL
jgi:predicted amidohydrolase